MVIDMTNTTLSKVMKKAWDIKKENKANIFSLCLKMAWSIIKNGAKKMVELVGSEKQIKWATDIKANMITAIQRFLESNKENDTETAKLVRNCAKEVENNNSAKWFIENRDLVEDDGEGNIFFGFKELIENKEGFRNREFSRMQLADWKVCGK